MEKKIEKPWAVYKGVMFFPIGVGLIVKEAEGGTLYIQYSERGSEKCWDPTYVSRFGTPIEAASYFVERREGVLEKKLNKLYENFPKSIKKEKLEELHNLLVQRRNILIAQSSPKCTEHQINYGTASFRLAHGLPIRGSMGGVDIGD